MPGVAAKKDKKVAYKSAAKIDANKKANSLLSPQPRRSGPSQQTGSALSDQNPSDEDDEADDPDLPHRGHGIDKATYMRLRDEYTARLRGIEPGRPHDPTARGRAIEQMERQQSMLAARDSLLGRKAGFFGFSPEAGPVWTALGPAPLPNGFGNNPVTGRVTAVVVDPTNSNKVYLGTAQGGVWRSLDGGTNWISIFDNAQSLAIGALALAPSAPTTLYVGTGEPNRCGDCFFGVGLYRIDNADTTATLVGPINPSFSFTSNVGPISTSVFTGRGISSIVVDPSNPATIFVGTSTGVGGSGATSLTQFLPPLALMGVYRSTNATSAVGSITFQKLSVATGDPNSLDIPATGNRRITDIVMELGNPNNLLVGVFGNASSNDGGIFRSTNALAGSPAFSQVLSISIDRIQFATNKNISTGVVKVLAATGETPSASSCPAAATQKGVLRQSVDGGATWPSSDATATTGGILTTAGGFCGGQCFYNVVVAIDPKDANNIYLGGNVQSSCSGLMQRSSDGVNFSNDANGLHPDSHALFMDPLTTPSTVFTGNDGGVWKRSASAAVGTAWTNLNSAPLNTLQFEGIAVHPTDRNLTIGGTQDNGTEAQQNAPGNWMGAESGDGGYALIDQSATDTINVTMYHTFFTQTGNLIGFDRTKLVSCLASFDSWEFRGLGFPTDPSPSCDGTAFSATNGLSLSDNVLFYAPMALGPGSPNTLYFGTDRLYRSTDRGDNMTVVSQAPLSINPGPPATNSPISTIAISPQDDNYRLVGLQNGQVWATSTGSATLVNITGGSFPPNPNGSATNKFVGRAMVDPNNKDVAYITFSFFAPAGQGVWKITNLGAAAGASPVAPSWTAAGNGIPSIPINAFAIDPANSNNLFAGTDIGVYNSTDGGGNWAPFGTGLPRVAVFDMALQNANRVLRVGTHGRGVWEIPTPLPNTVQFSPASFSVGEGGGNATITVTRTGNTAASAAVDFATNNGGFSPCNVFNGVALQNCDFMAASGTLTFNANETSKTFNVLIVDDVYVEGNETFSVTLSNPTGATTGSPSTATVTISDNDTAGAPSILPKQFVANLTGAQEVPATNNAVISNGGVVQLSASETSAQVSLLFSGLSGAESAAHVHGPAAPGVNAPIIFPLALGNPLINFQINPTAQQVADLKTGMHYLNVHSAGFLNGEIRGQLLWNPLEEASFFVKQQYYDFLSREPDQGGFDFWTGQITQCLSDVECLRNRRVNVSNAIFYELEFQQTASYVYRLYRAAYGNNQPFPNPDLSLFFREKT